MSNSDILPQGLPTGQNCQTIYADPLKPFPQEAATRRATRADDGAMRDIAVVESRMLVYRGVVDRLAPFTAHSGWWEQTALKWDYHPPLAIHAHEAARLRREPHRFSASHGRMRGSSYHSYTHRRSRSY